MPQDGRKSARYRPFVTCNDPKGVVECGTIRKSKLSSYKTMEPTTDSQTRFKDPNKTLASINSLQLSEVSKGAQKLNHMIDSWSRNLTVEGHPKDLANNLLKGALDLQESLVMLGKLQAASTYVAKLKKKQEKGNNNGGQEARVFWKQEESSKIDELKEIIKSSFEGQNLLRVGNGGKRHFSEPDIPSTSSSISSSSYSDKIDQKLEKSIAKRPGIIARLMGLEETSSQLKDRICEDISGEKKKKKKTLQEVLDTMHRKGLLKGSSVKPHLVPRNTDMMMHPIVLIKPLQIPPPEVKNVGFCEVLESTNGRRSNQFREKVEKAKSAAPTNRELLTRENVKPKNSDRKGLEKGTTQKSRPNLVVTNKGNDSSKKRRESGVKKELRTRRRKDQQTVNVSKEAKVAVSSSSDTELVCHFKKGSANEDEVKIDPSSEIDTNINQQSIEEERIPVKGYDYDHRRSLLLSNQSFLTRAEDLFRFISSSPENPDSKPPNNRLYIDCAIELIERKSDHHASETQCSVLSMEKLVEEVCDGIEILSSYWSVESDRSPVDGLYAVLKHDLNCNPGMVGSKLWDMGWNKGYSSDDVEKVVIELEEFILSCLIEELSQMPDMR